MPIAVKCSCGKALSAPDHLAGKRVKCPGCGNPLGIPGASAPAAKPAAAAPKPAAPAAKPPAPKAPAGAKPAARPPATPAEEDKPLHDYASCPNCNAFVSKKDAICIHCGLNLITGKKLSTVHSKEPTGPPKNIAMLCLVLNVLPLPGVGTLIGAGKSQRPTGFMQMGLGLLGIAGWVLIAMDIPAGIGNTLGLVPAGTVILPLLPYLGGAIWGIGSGLAILANAKP